MFFCPVTSIEEHEISLQDSLESKNAACRDFVRQLNESLAVWGGRLPLEARYFTFIYILHINLLDWYLQIWQPQKIDV